MMQHSGVGVASCPTIVHAAGRFAPDWVVFAEPDDTIILGAHSFEGLNFRVDPQAKQLVDAGPVTTGAAA